MDKNYLYVAISILILYIILMITEWCRLWENKDYNKIDKYDIVCDFESIKTLYWVLRYLNKNPSKGIKTSKISFDNEDKTEKLNGIKAWRNIPYSNITAIVDIAEIKRGTFYINSYVSDLTYIESDDSYKTNFDNPLKANRTNQIKYIMSYASDEYYTVMSRDKIVEVAKRELLYKLKKDDTLTYCKKNFIHIKD